MRKENKESKENKTIQIQVKPVSINDAYYMRRKVLNAKARAYREKFMLDLQLPPNRDILKEIQSKFDKLKHSLSVKFIIQVPKELLFTKTGSISRRSMDIDNLLKLPIDFLTNERYDNRIFNCGNCTNLNIDDQFITKLSVEKTASPDSLWYILIQIDVIPL